jgi:hypothetical protein
MTDNDGSFHSSVMNIDNYARRINTTGSSEQCYLPVKKGNVRFFTNTIEVVGTVKDNVPKGDVNANTSFVPLNKRSYIENDEYSTEPRKSSSKHCQDSGLPSLLMSRYVRRGSILKDGFEEPVPEDAHESDSSDTTNEESTSKESTSEESTSEESTNEESTSEESTSEESGSSSSEDDDLSDPEPPVISRCKKSDPSRFPALRLEDNDAESDSDSSSSRLDDEIFDNLRRLFNQGTPRHPPETPCGPNVDRETAEDRNRFSLCVFRNVAKDIAQRTTGEAYLKLLGIRKCAGKRETDVKVVLYIPQNLVASLPDQVPTGIFFFLKRFFLFEVLTINITQCYPFISRPLCALSQPL